MLNWNTSSVPSTSTNLRFLLSLESSNQSSQNQNPAYPSLRLLLPLLPLRVLPSELKSMQRLSRTAKISKSKAGFHLLPVFMCFQNLNRSVDSSNLMFITATRDKQQSDHLHQSMATSLIFSADDSGRWCGHRELRPH